jgi:hypothetical protein
MSHDPVERDAALERALGEVAGDPLARPVDWTALSNAIVQRAGPELARRERRGRVRFMLPAALAASVLLLVQVVRPAPPAATPAPATAAGVESVSVEELLQTDVSDGQLRALLFGAAEVDDLLLIVAAEDLP